MVSDVNLHLYIKAAPKKSAQSKATESRLVGLLIG